MFPLAKHLFFFIPSDPTLPVTFFRRTSLMPKILGASPIDQAIYLSADADPSYPRDCWLSADFTGGDRIHSDGIDYFFDIDEFDENTLFFFDSKTETVHFGDRRKPRFRSTPNSPSTGDSYRWSELSFTPSDTHGVVVDYWMVFIRVRPVTPDPSFDASIPDDAPVASSADGGSSYYSSQGISPAPVSRPHRHDIYYRVQLCKLAPGSTQGSMLMNLQYWSGSIHGAIPTNFRTDDSYSPGTWYAFGPIFEYTRHRVDY